MGRVFVVLFCLFLSLSVVNTLRVTCVGDSNTEGWQLNGGTTLPQYLATLLGSGNTVLNAGVSGKTVQKNTPESYWSTSAYTNAINSNPDVVLIMLGSNDAKNQYWNYNNVKTDYKYLINIFRTLSSSPKVLISTPPFLHATGSVINQNTANNILAPLVRLIASEEKVALIELHGATSTRTDLFQADRIHLTVNGNSFAANVFHHSILSALSFKPRLFVLTDISNEPDDEGSMIRLLEYSNEFDIEGLVATTSRFLKSTVRPDVISGLIDTYATVRPTLLQHRPDYPEASFLSGKVASGPAVYGVNALNDAQWSTGAQLLVNAVDRADARPLWVSVWGGANTLAQALWRVRNTRSTAQVDAFCAKLRVYAIEDQDETANWIKTNFPQVFIIFSPPVGDPSWPYAGGGTWSGISGEQYFGYKAGADFNLVSNSWSGVHVRANHGPLGAEYPIMPYIMEGTYNLPDSYLW